MYAENESIEFWMCSTDSECDDKDKESSDWKKGDCHVLAPVASGTVDTGEVVGVDWWSMTRYTTTTQLTLSVVYTTHEIIDLRNFVGWNWYEKSTSYSMAIMLTRTDVKQIHFMIVSHAVTLV